MQRAKLMSVLAQSEDPSSVITRTSLEKQMKSSVMKDIIDPNL